MNKKMIVVAGSVLSLAVSAIGISALSGCKSNMAALNSELPNTVNGPLMGEYTLEHVTSNAENFDADAIRSAIQKETTVQSIFKGRVENQDALPVEITVDCATKDANGSIAGFNNLIALCTLSIWPCVDADEYEYTVTASSVVGSRKVSFRVLERNWFGISPLAMIPVPGWSDERGDKADIKRYHAAQIALVVKEVCAGLPDDYALFKKDQPRYLELISQSRSERAFATFRTAEDTRAKVEALARVVNKAVLAKHQDDLVAAFKSSANETVRAAILTKLIEGSFDKLPYDPTLIAYWPKLNDSRLLAMVYRDGYAKLSEADRKNLVAKISDDAVLTEMVTAPSREAKAKWKRQQDELKEKIAELQRDAESHKRYAESANDNLRFNEAKRENKKAEKCMAQIAALQKKLAKVFKGEGLYVNDAKARVSLYQAMKPESVKKLADAMLAAYTYQDWRDEDDSTLESVADMSVVVADKNMAAEIAISIACKVDSYWRECAGSWRYRWNDADKKKWAALKKKITPALTDNVLVSKIKADRKLWSALAELIGDKSKVSALAYGFVVEAVESGDENKIKEAWKLYGGEISVDAQLMKLSIVVLPLRRPAFLRIKDDAMKAKTLAVIKDSLNAELERCAKKQRQLAKFIAEIGNGDELVAWLRGKSGQTDIQRRQAFSQLKGRIIVLKGDVREIGKTAFTDKLFVSLHVGNISTFVKMNVQFNIPDKLTPIVSSWQKGETYIMRGKITSTGDMVDDVETENAEIVKTEDYNAAVGLKAEMDNIKWQIKEIDEKKMPPKSVTPSQFGGAVKRAAGWLKRGVDDVKASGDDIREAVEMINGFFN